MDTNKDKNEFLNNLCKNSDSEDNEDVTWNQHDNFIDNQSSNALKNKQMNNVEQIQNSKGTTTTTTAAASTSTATLPNQDDIIPAFKKMNIRETSANKSKQQRSKDLALNYYFGVGERQSNQNGNNEDPFETNNNKQQQQDATTYMQFNHNNFFQQNVTQQQQQQQSTSLQINTNNNTTNNTSQQLEQELLNEQQHQQPQSNFTSLFNVNDNNNNNNNTNNNSQRGDTGSLIEKYNVNSQPYIPKNKDLNYYKNAQLQPSQHQLLPNTNVDNQLYKLNLSKSSNIPGKFYVIKSVDEANIIRVRIYIYIYIYNTYIVN